MPYTKGTRLPGEVASKLGHINVVKSEWVNSMIKDFEFPTNTNSDPSNTIWHEFSKVGIKPLENVWAVDGSFAAIASDGFPRREVAFVKTALLNVDSARIEKIDKLHPHPLLMQDMMANSAIFHATVFPLRNIRTSLGTNYDAVRHIVRDSMKIDENGAFYETLKWLAYRKWKSEPTPSPDFMCPHCREEGTELTADSDEGNCNKCGKTVFLTDMIGFHLDMNEDSAKDAVATSYMIVMETLMLLTVIRLLWDIQDKSLLSETLFIKDGPLSLRSQYSKIVTCIREFLEHAKNQGRPIHIIGQEKSGNFYDHLSTIARFAPPKERGQNMHYATLTHEFVHKEVNRTPNLKTLYGKRSNWGEKVYVKFEPGTYMVLNIPTGSYIEDKNSPCPSDLIGLDRILATLPRLISYKFEGALFPVELANGIASMSSYPSSRILQKFIEGRKKE